MNSSELFLNDVHPRILFGPDDVPLLRERVKKGIPAKTLAEILRRSERYTDPSSEDYVDLSSGLGKALERGTRDHRNNLSDAFHCLPFARVLTGENSWFERFEPFLNAVSDDEPFARSSLLTALPLAFDLLHADLDETMRNKLSAIIRTMVTTYQETELATTGNIVWGLGTNTFISRFGHYPIALAAVYDAQKDRRAMELIEGFCRRSIHKGVDEGGAIYEGPSYGQGDIHQLSMAAEILLRAGITNLWETEPRFANMARHWVYLTLPGKRGQNTPCDAWRLRPTLPNWALLLHARRSHDPVLQWCWEQMRSREDIEGYEPFPARFSSNLGLLALWEDDDINAVRPDEANWPNSRNSGGMGFITMRTGWQDEDLYFTLLSSGRTPGCRIHQHIDGGNFCLFALNEAFSVDTGYGDIAGRYHSVLRPGAKEPGNSPKKFDQAHIGGLVDAFRAGEDVDYARVDVSRQWECRWYYRHAMLVKAEGAAPYVILMDDANHCDDFSSYEWLMNSEPGNRIEVDRNQQRASVLGAQHRLDVAWSCPADQGYDRPHQLEVSFDEIDSFQLSHREHDVDYFTGEASPAQSEGGGRWGIGVRPRIKALLSGYTGHLLTALMPRRQGQPEARIERLCDPTHFGMVIHWGDVTDTIIASPGDRNLALGGMSGEATLALARRNQAGEVLWWAAADAWALNADGVVVLPSQGEAAVLVEGKP